MNHREIIEKTAAFVKETLGGAEGSHDWWHVYRVWKMAVRLAKEEKADGLVVELGALLHDIADAKFHGGDEEIGPRKAKKFLESIGVEKGIVEHVECIIQNISFRKSLEGQEFRSLELDIVQDADRLDAIGAIGIARTFAYNGAKGRQLYDPAIKPNLHMTKEEYKASTAPTINHFYEKLLLLKDRMNTAAAKVIAEHRHAYMERYLEEFYREWEGER
jgi:uncharacterized protein